jgi:hypothetical protein
MKGITVILILSMFFSFIACTSTRKITKKDEIRNTLEMGEDIYLYTENSKSYKFFGPYHYEVSKDTLFGRGRVLPISPYTSTEDVRIAIEKIPKIEAKEYDGTKTMILIGGVVILGIVIYNEITNMTLLPANSLDSR